MDGRRQANRAWGRRRHSAFRGARCIGFDNHGSQEAKSLCVISPALLGPEYFREAAEILKAGSGGPPDRAKMAELMRRYGLTLAVPPHA